MGAFLLGPKAPRVTSLEILKRVNPRFEFVCHHELDIIKFCDLSTPRGQLLCPTMHLRLLKSYVKLIRTTVKEYE